MSFLGANWNPSPKDLRTFGRSMIIGLGLMGLLLWKSGVFAGGEGPAAFSGEWLTAWGWSGSWRQGLALGFWAIGCSSFIGSLAAPPLGRTIYAVWMGATACVGWVMTRVTLTVFFYLVVTPVAVIFRIIGRDHLRLRFPPREGESFWVDVPESAADPKRMERQF